MQAVKLSFEPHRIEVGRTLSPFRPGCQAGSQAICAAQHFRNSFTPQYPRKTPGNPVIMRSAALRHGRVRPCA